MATLHITGTPIGNMDDITIRALQTLKSVDIILCEDTRTTKKLLDRHGISKPTLSYHLHSKMSRVNEIIQMLKEGKDIALVSDAGTPGISDPGSELVRIVREECKEEIASGQIKIDSIPGPSAITAAVSIVGMNGGDFTFLGFLPHKKGRETLFKEIASSDRNMIFYESPHRILKTLESLEKYLKEEDRVSVCREMTKIFEEVVSGTCREVSEYFKNNEDKVRGEMVVVVAK